MFDKHLHKILVSLKQGNHDVKFLDQILAHTITTCLTHPTLTWNCLIRAFSICPTPIKSILVYNYSIKLGSILPDNYTYPPLLKVCSRLSSVPMGKQLHAHVVHRGFDFDIYVQNALVHFYGSVSHLAHACMLFDTMSDRDIASWNSLMGAYNVNTSSHSLTEILVLFKSLMRGCIRPDKITLVGLLSACTQAQLDEQLVYGRVIHAYAMKLGLGSTRNVNNALLDMYTKSKQMDAASGIFYEMGSRKDVVSYTILINGYVEMGLIVLAGSIFDQIVDKDIVLWNLMVHAYIKAKRPKDALKLFKKMENEGVMPDENTMVSLLAACSSLSDLHSGRLVHVFINKNNVKQDVYVKTALIDMYFKCGSLEEALVTFYKMEYKDVVAWTAVIEGLANHGYGMEALSLFNRMEEQGIQPNEATFVSILKGCSHSGLVNEGCILFKRMVEVYRFQPGIDHFGCLIDALSRAGLLHQADEFINLLQLEERLTAYKILLSACIKYSDFDVGEKVANEMAGWRSQSRETNILLSNFYALAGEWAQVAKTRRIMKRLNKRKEPGLSSLELK